MTGLEGHDAGAHAAELDAAVYLADQVRGLVARMVASDASDATYAAAAALVGQAAALLDAPWRPHPQPSRLDEAMPDTLRAHGLVVGPANPMAPPAVLTWEEDAVTARLRMSRAYEGPRGFVHGGVSALLLDEVTAKVRSLLGTGRVTRTLQVRYRRPVPLETDLVVIAALASLEGRNAVARGHIATAAQPTMPLVVAEAHFVLLGEGTTSSPLADLVD